MQTLFQVLNSIHPLSEGLIKHLSTIIKLREFKKKEYLLKAGHICRNICFVEKGLFRCFYVKVDSEVSAWFMNEGDIIISIESFYGQQPSYESIEALEDSIIYCIEYNELQAIYKNFPEFNFIGRVLTQKYHVLWAQQLYALRMQKAPERYKWLLENHIELVMRVPDKDIASYLSITPETLSRIKKNIR